MSVPCSPAIAAGATRFTIKFINLSAKNVSILFRQPDCTNSLVGNLSIGFSQAIDVYDQQVFVAIGQLDSIAVSSFTASISTKANWTIASASAAASVSLGMIVGIVFGVIVVVLGALTILYVMRQRKLRQPLWPPPFLTGKTKPSDARSFASSTIPLAGKYGGYSTNLTGAPSDGFNTFDTRGASTPNYSAGGPKSDGFNTFGTRGAPTPNYSTGTRDGFNTNNMGSRGAPTPNYSTGSRDANHRGATPNYPTAGRDDFYSRGAAAPNYSTGNRGDANHRGATPNYPTAGRDDFYNRGAATPNYPTGNREAFNTFGNRGTTPNFSTGGRDMNGYQGSAGAPTPNYPTIDRDGSDLVVPNRAAAFLSRGEANLEPRSVGQSDPSDGRRQDNRGMAEAQRAGDKGDSHQLQAPDNFTSRGRGPQQDRDRPNGPPQRSRSRDDSGALGADSRSDGRVVDGRQRNRSREDGTRTKNGERPTLERPEVRTQRSNYEGYDQAQGSAPNGADAPVLRQLTSGRSPRSPLDVVPPPRSRSRNRDPAADVQNDENRRAETGLRPAMRRPSNNDDGARGNPTARSPTNRRERSPLPQDDASSGNRGRSPNPPSRPNEEFTQGRPGVSPQPPRDRSRPRNDPTEPRPSNRQPSRSRQDRAADGGPRGGEDRSPRPRGDDDGRGEEFVPWPPRQRSRSRDEEGALSQNGRSQRTQEGEDRRRHDYGEESAGSARRENTQNSEGRGPPPRRRPTDDF
ncbi:hypothetical protein DFJ73DRAFT_809741 [Zopfochytrium polystomum]|nr:hypothetical protein DFJ73DRAFT_809741 [Zopfochytrium polystomum]